MVEHTCTPKGSTLLGAGVTRSREISSGSRDAGNNREFTKLPRSGKASSIFSLGLVRCCLMTYEILLFQGSRYFLWLGQNLVRSPEIYCSKISRDIGFAETLRDQIGVLRDLFTQTFRKHSPPLDSPCRRVLLFTTAASAHHGIAGDGLSTFTRADDDGVHIYTFETRRRSDGFPV